MRFKAQQNWQWFFLCGTVLLEAVVLYILYELPWREKLAVTVLTGIPVIAFMWQRMHYKRMVALRWEERQGRTRAEKRLRLSQQTQELVAHGGFVFPPIARIQSSFPDRRDVSIVHFHPDLAAAFHDVVLGLAEFSHLWVVFVFHANTNRTRHAEKRHDSSDNDDSGFNMFTAHGTFRGCVAKIVPPCKKDGVPVGVFACRSPHRPNAIGLSVAKLVKVCYDTSTLILEGLDVMDGTPVLDIKPYLPQSDSHDKAMYPSWVSEAYAARPFHVVLPRAVMPVLEKITLAPYQSKEDLASVLREVLSYDIRSRRQAHADGQYQLMFHGIEVTYTITTAKGGDQRVVEILRATPLETKTC